MAELRGFDEMLGKLKFIGQGMRVATAQGLSDAADHLADEVGRLLTLSSHPPGTPTPSAPGSPPSLVSGRLHRSVRVIRPAPFTAVVISDLVYSQIQEFGGQAGHSRLPPRPYMRPALVAALPGIASRMHDSWADALHI